MNNVQTLTIHADVSSLLSFSCSGGGDIVTLAVWLNSILFRHNKLLKQYS